MSPTSPHAAAPTSGQSPFFRRWAELVLRFRWLVLAGITATTVWAVVSIVRDLRIDNSVELFIPDGADSVSVLEELRDSFGRESLFMVVVEGDVFTPEFLGRLKALHDDLATMNPPLETLGERKADRDARRSKAPGGATVVAGSGTSGRQGATAPQTKGGDGGFDDSGFDDSGGDDSGFDDSGFDDSGFDDSGFDDSDFDDSGFDEGSFDDHGAKPRASDGDGWADLGGGTIVDELISPITARRTWMDGDTLHIGEWLTPLPTAEQLADVKARMLADPSVVGRVLDQAGRHAVLAIRTQFMAEEDSDRLHWHLQELTARHDAPGFKVLLGGGPALDATINRMMLEDMATFLGLSVLLMLGMLFWLFRHPVGVFAPIFVVLISVLWTLGLMAATGMPMGLISSILPAFIFTVGIGDSVHVLSVYRSERAIGLEARPALIAALGVTGAPVLFTTLTTMVGLLSFDFASVIAIRQVGLAGAYGVSMALLNTLLLLPIILDFFPKTTLGGRADGALRQRDWLDRALELCFWLSSPEPGSRRPRRRLHRTLLASAVLSVVAVYGVTQVRFAHDPLSWFADGTQVIEAVQMIDEHLGGGGNAVLLVEAPGERGIKDLEVLRALEQLEQHILAFEEPATGERTVANVYSVLDVVRETRQALHGGALSERRLPDTERGAADMLFLFENAGPQQLAQVASIDLRRTQIQVRTRWREASAYGPLIDHIHAGIERFIDPLGPDHLTVRPTGGVYMFYSVVTALMDDLLRSFSVALGVISLLMFFFLRHVKLALVAMLPNVMPILWVVAVMGFSDIEVDLNNLLIASIAIGIAVDDTIHLMHHFKVHLDQGASVEQALTHAREDAGRAVVSTSVTLLLGNASFMLGSIAPTVRFGLLMSLVFVMALLVDLIVLPAVLRVTCRQAEPANAA